MSKDFSFSCNTKEELKIKLAVTLVKLIKLSKPTFRDTFPSKVGSY